MSERTEAALEALLRAARRIAVARRMEGDQETVLLQSVVDAAATLFEAEAASIAIFEPDPDRLTFRVASGAQGRGVVGLSMPPTRGIAGYVFSTGEAMALSDVASDPRFDQATAERTGYVPRSIAAVPLIDAQATVGVLQVLDKRGSDTFSLRDMTLLEVFARQAGAAIRASRVARDSAQLLRHVLLRVADQELTDERLESLVSAAAGELDHEDERPFWQLVDRIAGLRDRSDSELELVSDILEVVARRRDRVDGYRRRTR